MVKNLRTIKRASEETGASESFLKKLLQEGVLKTYKIKTATYLSLAEFEEAAVVVKKQKIESL